MDRALDLFGLGGSGHGEIVGGLQVQPKLRVSVEIPGETQCGVGRDSSTPMDNLGHSRSWDAKLKGKLVDTHPEGSQVVLPNCLSGMGERDLIILPAINPRFLLSIALNGSQ